MIIQQNTNCIQTTHIGSLPRPHKLLDIMKRKFLGEAYDEKEFETILAQSVKDSIRKQKDCGIDIVTDGEFSKSGFFTGRKIIVDTYGGYAPHGGGAFSGKDPTKVDRSAAYAARYLTKNVVASGLADKCTIQVAYAIGVTDPMSLYVDTHGTGKVPDAKLEKILAELFPLRPTNIRRTLKLSRPIYRRTAAYGHFGRAPEKDGGFSWEHIDLAARIAKAVNQ